jgi:NAD(P)-dependent dehydrogenase (short-subunit alcohol dehydrogenase family)
MQQTSTTVLVTGTSSGFGDLISRTLASSGYRVFATMRDIGGRNAESAKQLREWAKSEGKALEVVELDVTDDASVASAVAEITKRAGAIDVVVNNAGASARGPIEAFSMEQIAGLIGLNALGPVRMAKAVLPAMRARGSGLIITISSTLGRVLPGKGGLYPASKWANEGLQESMRYQVAPFGVDMCIIEPGSYPSGATGKSWKAEHEDITAEYNRVDPPQALRDWNDRAYAPPDPQEVADAVKALIETPAGQRPLRTVVGTLVTEGVADYNAEYERMRAFVMEATRKKNETSLVAPA